MFEALQEQIQNLTQLVMQATNNRHCGDESDHESDHIRDAENEINDLVHISEFDGEMELDAILNWIENIESYFDWKDMLEERNMKFVGAKLRGPASTW
ncbi:unnamed protein product [Ilex paraguariensis]|uniref:Reverse transcriptase n=1 Tax=Ilex paraguariensis TaxID=185542 RepID=A0ABC8V4F8_9AQUA